MKSEELENVMGRKLFFFFGELERKLKVVQVSNNLFFRWFSRSITLSPATIFILHVTQQFNQQATMLFYTSPLKNQRSLK